VVKLITVYRQHIVDGINKICGGRRYTFVTSQYDVPYRDGFYKTKIAVAQLHPFYYAAQAVSPQFLAIFGQDGQSPHRTVQLVTLRTHPLYISPCRALHLTDLGAARDPLVLQNIF